MNTLFAILPLADTQNLANRSRRACKQNRDVLKPSPFFRENAESPDSGFATRESALAQLRADNQPGFFALIEVLFDSTEIESGLGAIEDGEVVVAPQAARYINDTANYVLEVVKVTHDNQVVCLAPVGVRFVIPGSAMQCAACPSSTDCSRT